MNERFQRQALLTGKGATEALAGKHVIVFGVGGVVAYESGYKNDQTHCRYETEQGREKSENVAFPRAPEQYQSGYTCQKCGKYVGVAGQRADVQVFVNGFAGGKSEDELYARQMTGLR